MATLYKISDTYEIRVDFSVYSADRAKVCLTYQVFNNETQVIEGETSVLARAIELAIGMDRALKSAMSELIVYRASPEDDNLLTPAFMESHMN